jgi:cellulose biosynthesis protein BcsQ
MFLAIWGRDGIGKSTLADTLGITYAQKQTAIVIDTDMTQPTVSTRINKALFEERTSLGRALSRNGEDDAAGFLHQHPNHKNLFYAGLTDKDAFLSYEIGLEGDEAVRNFIMQCTDLADTVILDVSGQRYDPFLFGALLNADKVIIPITPDAQGFNWFNAIRPLIEELKVQDRILPVAAMVGKHHHIELIEEIAGVHFAACLPFSKEIRFMRDSSLSPLDGTTPAAFQYMSAVRKICVLLKGCERF